MPKILIVDDHSTNRSFLATLLGYAGHSVWEASDGVEALVVARQERPDLIVSDIVMPTMDGYEFIRQLRSDPDIAASKVIFYSASYYDREAIDLARRCGVSSIIRKPSEPQVVLEAIQAALSPSEHGVVDAVPADFAQDHRRLLTDKLSEQVSMLEEIRVRLAALLDLVRRNAFVRDPRALCEMFCKSARTILGARHAAVILLDVTGGAIEHSAFCGDDAELEGRVGAWTLDATLRFLVEGGKILTEQDLNPGTMDLPPAHPPIHSFLAAPIQSNCRGVLYVANRIGPDSFNDSEQGLISMLASHFAVSVENARLYLELNRRAELLQEEVEERKRAEGKLEDYTDRLKGLSRRLMEVRETEQRHIARELHDEIGQELTALKIHLQAAKAGASDSELSASIGRGLQITEQALQQVRSLTLNLRPSILDDLGLVPAVRWLLDRNCGSLTHKLTAQPAAIDLPLEIRTVCFRVIQEAVTNIVRHANASSVQVRLQESDGSLLLEIDDDGKGFVVSNAKERARSGNSTGLLGMEERVHLVGGEFRIESTAGSGTKISVRIAEYKKERC